MPKISVVILTLNEEKNISRCLESILEIADDIVVVDSFSTDRTEEICKQFGARFIQHKFEGHIEQKNWAITQALYPHVLSLDADEALSEKLKNSILEIKNDWKYDGYYFNRLTNYCGKWIRYNSWYPSRKLRLWDSSKGQWGGINPHDEYILEKGSTKKYLKGDLIHYSYYSISEHLVQLNKFSTIIANAHFQKGRKSNLGAIVIRPAWRFFRDYFIRLGFLDGFYGLVICINSSYETFLKYAKLRALWKNSKTNSIPSICFFNSIKTWGGGEKEHFDIANRLAKNGSRNIYMFNKKGELFKRFHFTKSPIYHINIHNLSFLNVIKIARICTILKKEKVKTIFITLPSDLKVAGIAAKLAGINQIIYRRGNAVPVKNSMFNKFLYRKIASRIIANSLETKRCVLLKNNDLIDHNKIDVIYNGIDLNHFTPDDQIKKIYQKKNNEILIGNAARLSNEKGQIYLVKLAKILKDKGISFKMLIAGTGKLKQQLINKAIEYKVDDKIIFLGFIEDIKPFYQSIDIFCFTSLYEGFGYAMVESMAMKKPVVAFDIKSSSEIIVHNETGFLVKEFNLEKFAELLIELINDRNKCYAFGEAGRKRVEDIFNLNKLIDKMERVIINGQLT